MVFRGGYTEFGERKIGIPSPELPLAGVPRAPRRDLGARRAAQPGHRLLGHAQGASALVARKKPVRVVY